MSPELRRRYGRQIRLADVGERGQEALCAAEVSLATSGFARVIEERYLRAAGVRVRAVVDVGDERSASPAELGLRHDAARDVATGAYHALVAVRRILALAPTDGKSG